MISKASYSEDMIPAVYIWGSLGDVKVRSLHQENDGKIFTRDKPPSTGHPGQSYNHRCIAEPYIKVVTECVNQKVISDVREIGRSWRLEGKHFLLHFWFGGGGSGQLG